MKFIKHIPAFVDTRGMDENISKECSSIDDLLDLPDLVLHSSKSDFSHFAVSDDALMAIRDNGFHWWVVGYVDNDAAQNFPKWCGGKYRATIDGVEVILDGGEVVSSCAGVLTLSDGRVAYHKY